MSIMSAVLAAPGDSQTLNNLRILGYAGLYLLGNLVLALLWSSILSRIKLGWLISLLAAPVVPAAASFWLMKQPYQWLLYGAWVFALGTVTFTVRPAHQTKSGRADRRHKHNPDTSGITGEERAVAFAGALSVVAVMMAAWKLGWPGSTMPSM
jgi:hypothetical protein